MSIFQSASDQNANGASPIQDLVGEGKKFKTVDDLAKGKVEADAFIEKLQREQKELREELERRLSVEDALKKAQEAGVRVDPPKPAVSDPPQQAKPQGDADIDSRITKALEARDRTKVVEDNLQAVTKRLVDTYGTTDKAAEIVKARSEELGMTVEQLGRMAADNPKAFFRLVGVDDKAGNEAPKTSSWNNVKNTNAMKTASGNSVVQPGTYKWYNELRRENPAQYFSPRIQLQMDKDAREKGEAFYK